MSEKRPPARPRTPAEQARDRAVAQAIDTAVYLGVVAAVSVAIAKRDYLTRLYTRLRYRPVPAEEIRARYLCAELARDLSRIEHGDGPPPRPRGLYER